jgi:1-acyl-sn-glycerol-3-phosphate acyltransferase
LYYIEKLLAHILILFLIRFQIKGRENVPSQGSFLVVSNHLSVADPVILGTKLGRRITFLAKEDLFKNAFHSFFVRSFGAFPVYREGSNRDALRQAAQVLRQGNVLGMFPEGKRSSEARLRPALYGSALIAYHNKVPILPVSIYGSETVRGFKWILHRPSIVLSVGHSYLLPDVGHALTKKQLAEFTDITMQHIAGLLPEDYQGKYAEKYRNGT